MSDDNVLLERLTKLTNKTFLIVSKKGKCIYPENWVFDISLDEIFNNINGVYRDIRVYELGIFPEEHYVCIRTDEAYAEKKDNKEDFDLDELLLLSIKSILKRDSTSIEYLKDILDGRYNSKSLNGLEIQLGIEINGCIVIIEGPDIQDNYQDIHEIIVNTMESTYVFDYRNYIIVITQDSDVNGKCTDLRENILSELFLECNMIISDYFKDITELNRAFKNCTEVLFLKEKFDIIKPVLSFSNMFFYRIVSNMDIELKKNIYEKVFTSKFVDVFNSEVESTMETFFSNNLNLTDTASKLYVHRNTLLYRLDKICKYSGYDIRKLEDSWLLRLAMLIHKEIVKENKQ